MTGIAANPTDQELLAGWRRGDEAAARNLVHRHGPALGRYLKARGSTSDDVEDLLQESFFRAFRAADRWRGDGSFRGWLFRIGANLLKDRYRSEGGRVFVELSEGDLRQAADPESELVSDEAGNRLQETLAQLPRLQREVFRLRVEDGLDYRDIAVALDTTPGAARVHYHHAMKRLKECLQ